MKILKKMTQKRSKLSNK